ncbi:Probable LRR receptor-like serine/threonine-protein kinase At1g74360 [Linum perenne]
MAEDEADPNPAILFLLFSIILLQVNLVAGDSLAADRDALLGLKSHLISRNRVNPGRYLQWNQSNPCNWPGISCSSNGSRVIGIDLADDNISGELYGNFSSLTALEFLDLSRNSLLGSLPADLSNCQTLAYLNLSHNILRGEVNFTGLRSLEVIDLAKNRFSGGIQFNSPGMCMNLVVANLSENFFIGRVDHSFVGCSKLQYLDLSSNHFVGGLWSGFSKLKEFSASENGFNELHDSDFDENCSLISLDIAENSFTGMLPGNVSNCKNLTILNAGGNHFSGLIPSQIGRISGLASLLLGNNSFSSDIPETLLNLKNLTLVDLSRNSFGGKIQPIFGRFTQAKFMVLSGNAYTGGLHSSGLLSLTNLVGLDLSYNNFSTPLPVELSQMRGLKFLIMAHNQFTGSIPEEYGNLTDIQALDLSFNRLTGSIPSSLGELKYLLWLMLANNTLSGRIPSELGRCNSLLWLNLSNNRLSGTIPSQLMNIGSNPEPTFRLNLLVLAILICGGLSFVIHILGKTPQDTYLLQEGNKFGVEFLTGSSSSDTVKIIRLDKTAFTHADILSATENFSERRIVGRGGFGTVYRGVLPNGRQVAVKKLLREGIEGEKEFRAEMEVLTGNGGHPNLVALHGWCLDGCQRILVYEFMEGGALEDLVADRGRLSWRRRAEIAVDVARALVFLHHECYPAVVHRDVKASNVLLDQEGRARVTDFGLARFVDVGRGMVSAMEGAAEMWELLRIGVRCTAEAPQGRPNMKEVLGMLVKMLAGGYGGVDLPPPR